MVARKDTVHQMVNGYRGLRTLATLGALYALRRHSRNFFFSITIRSTLKNPFFKVDLGNRKKN